MKKYEKNTFIPALLALGVSAALIASCNHNGNDTKDEDRTANAPVPQAVTVSEPESMQLEEIIVTGSRMPSQSVMRDRSANYAVAQTMRQQQWQPDISGENYADFDDNQIKLVHEEPVSTFSIDVDSGAYSNVRRMLNDGYLPPEDAVRAEEFINYFSYDYALSTESGHPFSTYTELSVSPWNKDRHLLHIGIQAIEPDADERLDNNLVFLLDVSGSMNSPDKLGLLKTSLKMLSRQLDEQDSVSIVVYAGASGVVLEPTAGNDTSTITRALDQLQAGGSTNGAAGIELAYQLAEQAFLEGGVNRVILATDGDFNVGVSDVDTLKDIIERKRESGISLTTLGFGTGNYNDVLMEQLADIGNGNYAYIDNINEARKVLVDELGATLQTVAKDVKIQIEFNPDVVAEYRLVGYENRMLNREDFNNDKVDAGEIGAGHSVTAIYELTLVDSENPSVDPLRYGNEGDRSVNGFADSSELAYLKLRYKQPDEEQSTLIQKPLMVADIQSDLNATSNDYRFSVAVAGLAQLLRNSDSLQGYGYDQVLELANEAKGDDPFGYRGEFINLARTAQVLAEQ